MNRRLFDSHMKVLLIDGYVDEPGCLGVPPYLAPYPRYIYGVLAQSGQFEEIKYVTIDQFRHIIHPVSIKEKKRTASRKSHEINTENDQESWKAYAWVIIITGVSVPGNYLGGKPIKFSELQQYTSLFPNAIKFLCGPATKFGIGEEGGKPSVPADRLNGLYDYIITGNAEIFFSSILSFALESITKKSPQISEYLATERTFMEQIMGFAIEGASLIIQHPNFNSSTGGNLICEIESFRGCPRYISGGCSFCTEPSKGPTQHRTISAIVDEINALYDLGVCHFRIGNQTDFYAFQHGDYDNPRYPRQIPLQFGNCYSPFDNAVQI